MNNLFKNNTPQIPRTSTSVSTQTAIDPSFLEASQVNSTPFPLFSLPPPPIKSSKTCSSQTDPCFSKKTIVDPAELIVTQLKRKSAPGSQVKPARPPPRVSLLGNPPPRPRVVGSIPSLSLAFLHEHGRSISENVKSVNINKKKKPKKKPKNKPYSKIKPRVKTAVLVDVTTDPEKVCIAATPRALNVQNSGRPSEHISSDLIDLDSPEVSNKFGEPLEGNSSFNFFENLNC